MCISVCECGYECVSVATVCVCMAMYELCECGYECVSVDVYDCV